MQDLTPRQTEILKKIIQEYTDTAEAVGSEILDKKYNLGVSPATVRNEMVELAKKGYLKKSHFSSGRVPTSQAFRFYIRNLMQEKELSTQDEVSYKSDIWDFRAQLHQLLYHATKVLAKRTNMLAAATTNVGDIYYSGVHNILQQKEFWNVNMACGFFEKLDELPFFKNILDEFDKIENELLYMLGQEELHGDEFEECASVFGEFHGTTVRGAIGVMGPRRMRYDVIVPNVRYTVRLLETILKEQGL